MGNESEKKQDTEQKTYLIINKQIVPLYQDAVRFGRHLDNNIVLHEGAISRFHAEIRPVNGHYVLYDLNSTSGTYVNNQRIEHCVLNSGDVISLADSRIMFINNNLGYLNQTQKVTETLSINSHKRQLGKEHYTILVIDDEPNLLLGVAALLKRRGYDVIIAGDGTEGLKLARSTRPDLILSDIMMPPPNGFEVKRLLGLEPELSTIPFIFLSAKAETEDRIIGIRDGADDYITKPFHPEELLERVKTIFRRVEAEQTRGREEMKILAAQEMEKLRREIMQNIHHEFRTPLVNVIMPLELAVANKFASPEEQLHFIKMALSNLEHLDSLVTDLIMLTGLDQNTLNTIRQSIDPQIHIVKPFAKRLQSYKRKNLEPVLDVKMETPIFMPRKEFTHAILHLAENAFKFSPPHGRVEVKIHSTVEGGIVINIKDEGIGIPRELQTKVFERYYQISQGDSRNYDGLGVGLTVAKAICESLGGTIEFLDVEAGCHVQMTIPSESQGNAS